MSQFSFMEVYESDHRARVVLGTADLQEVIGSEVPIKARLRIYVPDKASTSGNSSMTAFGIIQGRLQLLAKAGSAVRDSLSHYLGEAHTRYLFTVSAWPFTTLEPFSESFLQDFADRSTSDLVLLVELVGAYASVLKLLDVISEDLTEGEASFPVPASHDPLLSSIEFRDTLLGLNWPDGKRIADRVGSNAVSNPAQYASRQRSEGKLLGAWSVASRSFVHPDFQFDAHGSVRPEVEDLLAILPAKDDRGGWRRTFWLYSPHPQLDGAKPADVFVTDPARVIEVAKREFAGGPDADW